MAFSLTVVSHFLFPASWVHPWVHQKIARRLNRLQQFPQQKLRHPHGSVPFNPQLAEPLYLTKYIERMGTGTGDMICRCREVGLPGRAVDRSNTQAVRAATGTEG